MKDDYVHVGATGRIVPVKIRDASTGQGKTGVAFGDVSIYRTKNNTAAVQITTAAGSVGDAHSSGKWVEVDATNAPGRYLFHEPDSLFDTEGFVAYDVVITDALEVSVEYTVKPVPAVAGDVPTAAAIRAEIDSNSTQLALLVDGQGYQLTILAGALSNAGTAAEAYTFTYNSVDYSVTYAGLDGDGNRGTTVLAKP